MARSLNFFSTDSYNQKLKFSSQTANIANKRNAVYEAVMDNFTNARNALRQLGLFDSASLDMQASTLGVTLKEASMQAYLDSFLGYLAIERPLTQMKELLVYKDMITRSGNVVLPMIGKQSPRDMAQESTSYATAAAATTLGAITLGAVVPGSVTIKYVETTASTPSKNFIATDDRKGGFNVNVGSPVTALSIDYSTGAITSTTSALTAGTVYITFTLDRTLTQADSNVPAQNTRLKPRQSYFEITAAIQKFEYEIDIIMAAINSKTVGSDLASDMMTAVRDEHRMAINNNLVKTLIEFYDGNTNDIDLSSFSLAAGRFDSALRVFNQGLIRTDSLLGAKTYKAVAATAYVVGSGIADLFMSMDSTYDWVPNTTGFVNGLVGFYKGRAVLRHIDYIGTWDSGNKIYDGKLQPWDGYAVHKTMDGELAPVGYGLLLPATDLPLVGNYLNTNEVASGLYAVEGVNKVTMDLVQKFTVTPPTDWNSNSANGQYYGI